MAGAVQAVMRKISLRPTPRLLVAAALLAVAVGLTAAVPPARAVDAGFRCANGRLVREGETKGDVARKCGDPDSTRTWDEVVTQSVTEAGQRVQRSVVVVYDEWQYDYGRGRLIRYVTFAQGRLVRVSTGGYGD